MATPTFDISGHPLLSAEAGALTADELDAEATTAETVLGLDGRNWTGDKEARAKAAIVQQVNFQLQMEDEASYLESEAKGDQSFTYRTTDSGEQIAVAGVALRMARRLKQQGFGATGSFR